MTKKIHFLLLSLAFLIAMPAFGMQKTRKQKKREKKIKQDVKRSNAKHQQQIVSELSDAHKKITATKNELQSAQQELIETSNALLFEHTVNTKLVKENESLKMIKSDTKIKRQNLLNRQWFIQRQENKKLRAQLSDDEAVKQALNERVKVQNKLLANSRTLLQEQMTILKCLQHNVQTLNTLSTQVADTTTLSADEQDTATVSFNELSTLLGLIPTIYTLTNKLHTNEQGT